MYIYSTIKKIASIEPIECPCHRDSDSSFLTKRVIFERFNLSLVR